MSKLKKKKKPDELTDEQYSKLLEDLDNFDNGFFSALAETDKYEIVPTTMDDGSVLTKEQYALVKTECSRLGLKVLFQIHFRNGSSILVNPKNLKTGYIHEGMH
jgi:hypothetical protein